MKIRISSELSDADLYAICEAADVLACECPSYLVRLVQEVRAFRQYTTDCIQQFPEDATTHHWLTGRAKQVESLLCQTIVELLQKENLIDEQDQVCLTQLSDRSRSLALAGYQPEVRLAS
ncbi:MULTISPECIES: hypothetical protein [Trichocoleus]|uniref:Uncharacterized protein n=1 Tax=Trichocoleus desertorum GB2-A4 TaxID=2933944 RepID=A0ABV0J9L6_9CYAN|nr:hypothetical protein [Trichocoleus sp. FACHB-46]MBD1862810.1 hypothetical protein [Trichocoleus sp. FACHB-46]